MKRFNWHWAAFAILSFVGVICFFQVDSYKADLNNLNTVWIAAGIVCAAGAIYFIKKV